MNRKWNDTDLVNAINNPETKSLAEVMRKLGLVPKGGTYNIVKKYIDELGLDISHFTGQGHLKGKRHTHRKQPIETFLIENSHIQSYKLKNRLLDENFFEHKCYKCGLSKWNNQNIPIELEHINGVPTDNRLENLTILCPNCHAQTPTYRGKNIKRKAIDYKCSDCGRKISKSATKCKSCTGKKQKRKIDNRPSHDILLEEIKENGYSSTGRKYGVSDNTVRNWLK